MTYGQPGSTALIPVYPIGDADEEGSAIGDIGNVITGFRGASRIATSQIKNIPSEQAIILAASDPLRRTVTIKNISATTVFVGNREVTVTTGYRILAGEKETLECAAELYGRTDVGADGEVDLFLEMDT
jgi:hypothetical protein